MTKEYKIIDRYEMSKITSDSLYKIEENIDEAISNIQKNMLKKANNSERLLSVNLNKLIENISTKNTDFIEVSNKITDIFEKAGYEVTQSMEYKEEILLFKW